MYDKYYQCTYHLPDVILDTDPVTEEQKNFIRSCVYRQDLLNILELDDYDMEKINEKMDILYTQIKYYDEAQIIFEKLVNLYNTTRENAFIILFSYDYLYLFHPCMSEYLETGLINPDKIKKLEDILL